MTASQAVQKQVTGWIRPMGRLATPRTSALIGRESARVSLCDLALAKGSQNLRSHTLP